MGTVLLNSPVVLLMTAGLVNSLILPVILGSMLLATRRKDIIGDYQHPQWLTALGSFIVIVMAGSSVFNVMNFINTFIG